MVEWEVRWVGKRLGDGGFVTTFCFLFACLLIHRGFSFFFFFLSFFFFFLFFFSFFFLFYLFPSLSLFLFLPRG